MPSYNKSIDDPLDVYIFRKMASVLVDPLHHMGLSPSKITSVSLVLASLSPIFYLYDELIAASILYLIYYILDCADGQVARKFDQCSKFGAVYDWNKDHLVGLFLVIAFFLKSDYFSLLLILIFIYPMLLHVGTLDALTNYEKTSNFYVKTEMETETGLFYKYYSFSRKICYYSFSLFFHQTKLEKIFQSARVIRYFGTGIFTVLIILSISGLGKISFLTGLATVIICVIIRLVNYVSSYPRPAVPG